MVAAGGVSDPGRARKGAGIIDGPSAQLRTAVPRLPLGPRRPLEKAVGAAADTRTDGAAVGTAVTMRTDGAPGAAVAVEVETGRLRSPLAAAAGKVLLGVEVINQRSVRIYVL